MLVERADQFIGCDANVASALDRVEDRCLARGQIDANAPMPHRLMASGANLYDAVGHGRCFGITSGAVMPGYRGYRQRATALSRRARPVAVTFRCGVTLAVSCNAAAVTHLG